MAAEWTTAGSRMKRIPGARAERASGGSDQSCYGPLVDTWSVNHACLEAEIWYLVAKWLRIRGLPVILVLVVVSNSLGFYVATAATFGSAADTSYLEE